jgi:hypothetical protein
MIGVLRLQCTSRRPHISPNNQEAKVYFPAVLGAESQSLTVASALSALLIVQANQEIHAIKQICGV